MNFTFERAAEQAVPIELGDRARDGAGGRVGLHRPRKLSLIVEAVRRRALFRRRALRPPPREVRRQRARGVGRRALPLRLPLPLMYSNKTSAPALARSPAGARGDCSLARKARRPTAAPSRSGSMKRVNRTDTEKPYSDERAAR